MEIINKDVKADYERRRLEDTDAPAPQSVTVQQASPNGGPVDLGGGIVCMPGDYYHRRRGKGDRSFVIAKADIGEYGAWEEVTQ